MKRIIILILMALSIITPASAQSTQRQKAIHMAAVRIADEIGLGEQKKASFIAIYQEYKKEVAEIMSVPAPVADNPETLAEKKILQDFDKSEKILQLRKRYYTKFRSILSPTQIQKMYNAERQSAQ